MEYRYLETNPQLEAFADELKRRPGATVAVDSETNGLDPLAPGAALHLLQVGLEGEAPAVINAHKTNLAIIRPVLEDGRLCILQNAKFDLRWLAATRGIRPRRIYDTMLGEQLLNAGRFDSLRERRSACSLKNLADKYCALSLDKEIRMGFVRAKGPEFSQELLEYAAHDIPCLFPIRRAQTEELVKAGMLDTAKLEFATVVVVAAMELAGIGIDERQYHGLIEANTHEMAAAEAAVLELLRGWGWQTNLLGEVDINLGSVPQLRRAFRHEGHPTESTDDDALKVLEAKGSELAARLRVYRDWSKQVQAFGENVLALIHPRDLRLHPEFDQLGSDAGRFSCKGPNLQQMPREARYRRCFVPAPGNKLVVADYSAFEMRILAQFSRDPSLIEAFELGRDMHSDTASRMYGIPYEQVDKKGPERQAAKCFHPDTEVLTRSGWKRILDLEPGEEVTQAVPEPGRQARMEWARPLEVFAQNHPSAELIHFSNEGFDVRVTPDHRMLFWRSSGKVEVAVARDLPLSGYLVNAGVLDQSGTEVEETLLRLAVAAQADGSYCGQRLRFGFTRERKVERLRFLLQQADLPYRESVWSNGTVAFNLPPSSAAPIRVLLDEKKFPWSWLGLSERLRTVVVEEAAFWDGHREENWRQYGYYSAVKQNVDVLQALCAVTGRKTNLATKTDGYTLSVKTQRFTQIRGCRRERETYLGEVACISVPSTFVLVRDRGKTLICGQTLNFALMYGMGPRSLAVSLKYSEGEARKDMDRYFSAFPRVKAWLDQAATDGLAKLECRTLGGRRRLMNPPESGPDYRAHCGSIERKCKNGPIQGTNSDALKLAMCRIYRDLESRGMGPGIVFCVHDEIGLEVAEKDAEAARALLQAHMIAAGRHYLPDVPVEVEAVVAAYWDK